MRWWHHAWPGLLATLNGVGFCRFAYTPLVPFMIAAGAVSGTGAAYLGAANLAGYLAGAALAAPLAARLGFSLTTRGCFGLSVIALASCIWSGSFWWYLPWRLLAGAAGAVLMVLAPSFLLTQVETKERGRSSGVIYAGVGTGIALSSLVMPTLAAWDISWAWAALAAGAALTTALTWPRWQGRKIIVVGRNATPLGLPAWFVSMAFGMDGIGFVPHMLFWVDYIARTLSLGMAAGAAQWLLLGLGAVIGPFLGGTVGDRIGLGRALVLAYAVKAAAVLVPSLTSAWPMLAVSSVVTGALTPGMAALSAARLTELVPAGGQIRAWGLATLVFGLFQAAGAYGMAAAYGLTQSYVPLYAAGAAFELVGMAFALTALMCQGDQMTRREA